MTDSQQDKRRKLEEDLQSSSGSIMIDGITAASGITSGSLLLHKAQETKKTWHKVAGVSGFVLAVLSGVMMVLSYRWAKKAENEIKQIDHEKATQTVSFSNEAVGGHVERRLRQNASQEISR